MKEHREPKRIFVIDNHPVVHEGLRSIIDNQDDLIVCGEAFGVLQALELFETLKPDLVIIDVSLGDEDGLQLIQEMRHLNADLPIMVFSARPEFDYAESILKIGASGYLMKNNALETVVLAIRTVLEGNIYLSETMEAGLLAQVLGRENSPSKPRGVVSSLSQREFEVFRLIGEDKSTRQIAQHLHRSPKTIETHLERIKQKLEINSGTELIHHAVRWMEKQN